MRYIINIFAKLIKIFKTVGWKRDRVDAENKNRYLEAP